MKKQKATAFQHARNFLYDSAIVGNVLYGFGADGSVESGIAIRHPGSIALSESHVTRSGLGQAQKVEGEIKAVDLLAHRGYRERTARISAASHIKDVFEPVAVVAGHRYNRFDDAVAGTGELGPARKNVSALALVNLRGQGHELAEVSRASNANIKKQYFSRVLKERRWLSFSSR